MAESVSSDTFGDELMSTVMNLVRKENFYSLVLQFSQEYTKSHLFSLQILSPIIQPLALIELHINYNPFIDVSSIIKIISNSPKLKILSFHPCINVDIGDLELVFSKAVELCLDLETISLPVKKNIHVVMDKILEKNTKIKYIFLKFSMEYDQQCKVIRNGTIANWIQMIDDSFAIVFYDCRIDDASKRRSKMREYLHLQDNVNVFYRNLRLNDVKHLVQKFNINIKVPLIYDYVGKGLPG